jgi:beta-N-acetylhexosaminidase
VGLSQLGQVIMTGLEGTELSDAEREFLSNDNIGGVILFKRNYEDPAQLAELVNEIQKCRSDYPLFISVDHEGGRVIRFQSHFTQFPSMNEIAQTDSPKLVYEVHKVMAEELGACGVNFSFSPVCDVLRDNTTTAIGDRAFSKDPNTVEKYISGAIRGLQTAGMIACAKHFPGHGNTTKDSHYDLPYIKQDMAEFEKIDFPPFHKAAKSKVAFMLMAHLVCDAIDSELPTSLSPKAYELLRKEFRFKNCIISDDMYMEAITKNWSTAEAATMAFNAGCDVLVYRFMKDAQEALEGLKEAYKVKSLKKDRVDESLKRIEDTKKQYLSEYKPVYIPEITEKFKKANGEDLLTSIQEALDKKA